MMRILLGKDGGSRCEGEGSV